MDINKKKILLSCADLRSELEISINETNFRYGNIMIANNNNCQYFSLDTNEQIDVIIDSLKKLKKELTKE